MFGTFRNIVARVKSAFVKVRETAQRQYEGPPVFVRTSRQLAALRRHRSTQRHGYRPPQFSFKHVKGRADRSQKERSNRRKAAR